MIVEPLNKYVKKDLTSDYIDTSQCIINQTQIDAKNIKE